MVSVPAEQRFERWYIPEPNSGCWLWFGGVDKAGYGKFRGHRSGKIMAHRFSFGFVPEGLEIDHKCRNKSCVNPEHLEAVTHQENMRRNPRICRNGHSLPETGRCLICNRLWQRVNYRRRKCHQRK